MEVPTMVIKVKYQETLRRFNVQFTYDGIDLNIDRLREKIFTLFNLTPNTGVILTYIDEDGDEVALLDDDDLLDVAKQALNPLRITVKLNSGKNGLRNCPSGGSNPLKSPCVQQPLQNVDSGDCEILKTVPESLCETVVKFSADLASKASSSASGVTELVDYFSKVGLSYLAHRSDFQNAIRTTTQSDKSSVAAAETKSSELSKVDPATLSLENKNKQLFNSSNDEKLGSVPGVIMKAPSLTVPGSNHVALEQQTVSGSQPVIDSLQKVIKCPKSKVVPNKDGEKGKAMKERVKEIGECGSKEKSFVTTSHLPPGIGKIGSSTNNFPTENATYMQGPNLDVYPVNLSAPYPIKVDYEGGRTKSLFLGSFGNSTGSIWAANPGISKLPDLCSSPSPIDDYSTAKIPVENVSAFRSHPASKAVTSSRSDSQNVDTFHVFHCGIFCDGCGVHPITGPRFKSKVKEDYDLCMICFAEMGNSSDYIRIDRPVVYPHHVLYDSHARDGVPISSQACRGFKVKSCVSKMDGCFVQDVNIADGTVMAPLTPFTKIWRVKNNGIVAWPNKTVIFWMGGEGLSNKPFVELKIPATGLAIDQELDIAVDCIAPELPGYYVSCWGLAHSYGQRFGQHLWIRIEVVASVAPKPQENVRAFNLNLPPLSSSLNDLETINVVPEPVAEQSQNEPDYNSTKFVEIIESVANLSPKTEQEMRFHIDNSFLVGNGASSSVTSAAAPVLHPIFGLWNVASAFPSILSDVLHPSTPLPDMNLPASEDEGMSFKSADLDEGVLTMSEDDPELDDVSEFSEWDPILDELLDMGFYDTEMNKKLLEKNNGSIKRVVMELIAAESK